MEITKEVEVEALPTELPEKIEINVESLANIDDLITVADLVKPTGVEILTDPNLTVVKIAELVSKEAQEDAAQEAAQAEAASAEGEEAVTSESGEATDGTQPQDNQKTEDKPQE